MFLFVFGKFICGFGGGSLFGCRVFNVDKFIGVLGGGWGGKKFGKLWKFYVDGEWIWLLFVNKKK